MKHIQGRSSGRIRKFEILKFGMFISHEPDGRTVIAMGEDLDNVVIQLSDVYNDIFSVRRKKCNFKIVAKDCWQEVLLVYKNDSGRNLTIGLGLTKDEGSAKKWISKANQCVGKKSS